MLLLFIYLGAPFVSIIAKWSLSHTFVNHASKVINRNTRSLSLSISQIHFFKSEVNIALLLLKILRFLSLGFRFLSLTSSQIFKSYCFT